MTITSFRPPSLPDVKVGGFWQPWIQTIRAKTADILYERCVAAGMFEQIDSDKPVPALRIPMLPGGVCMQMFWDSDVGKVIEVYANLLAEKRDAALEERVDGIIELFRKLQQPDGYLNSWYIRMQQGQRLTNLRDCHELYNAGHMLEGAVAYYQATGKRTFLDVMIRYIDFLINRFGTEEGKKKGYCGHEEIELALVKLFRVTGEKRYLDFAKYLIDQRGQQPNYFEEEAKLRNETVNENPSHSHEYNQSHKPVREQDKLVGHAVRAMYLFCGMADVSMETGDSSLIAALDKLWDDLTSKRLYVTGGMGPSADNEGFTSDYDLPNDTAYAETCAAIGLIFWARRMLGFTLSARYADFMELALYNGALSGLALDGSRFFYDNPLESHGGHHRWEWHRCPCCPPNISRLITSIGTYIYGVSDRALAVHLYCQSKGTFNVGGTGVRLEQATEYPWNGKVRITVGVDAPVAFTLALRIPGWSRGATATLNGATIDLASSVKDGYLLLERGWEDGDVVELDIPMPVRQMQPHPDIRQDVGRVAMMRGPILYCLEGVDNPFPLNRVRVSPNDQFTPEYQPDLLGGVTVLRGGAEVADVADWGKTLYREKPGGLNKASLTAVPYYAWDNRGRGEMLVWLPRLI